MRYYWHWYVKKKAGFLAVGASFDDGGGTDRGYTLYVADPQ
jgi:hypothetical protein